MSKRGPSSDSYKMPLVLMALGGPDALRRVQVFPGVSVPSNILPDVLSNRLQADMVHVNAWDFIERFEYGFGDDSAWLARFTLFDPYFDYLLPRLIVARHNQDRILVWFRWGWVTDGYQMRMSEWRAGMVLNAVPEFHQDGVRIDCEVVAPETSVKMLEKASARWPDRYPAHLIVKQAIEMPHLTNSPLNAGIKPPKVMTPVECEPFENSGNAIVMQDESPISFVRNTILPKCIPKDPTLCDRKMRLFESDRENGVMVLAPEGFQESAVEIKRTYHVGRGQSANVHSFRPADATEIANQLGGDGFIRAVTGDKSVAEAERNGVSADPTNASRDAKTSNRFVRYSFAHNMQELVQERQRRWAEAQALAIQAELEVVGDPHIYIHDYIEVRGYMGGTISAAGRPHPDGHQRTGPTLIPLISGQYTVLGYGHVIENGNYNTSMLLARAQQQTLRVNPASVDHSDDATTVSAAREVVSTARAVDETESAP